jgi:hypothetical protein
MPMTRSMNVRLPYESQLHKFVLSALMARKEAAKDKVEDRVSDFERHDDLYDCYLEDSDDTRVRKKRFEEGEPDYYTVYVPYSYATLLSAHTYWTSVFMGRSPTFQFTGRHGEPMMKVQSVEALIDYQYQVGRMGPAFYHWMHDAPKYGYGVIWDYWEEEWVQSSTVVEEQETFFGRPVEGRVKKVRKTIRTKGYQGNKVFNVHPAHFWPDWRVPLTQYQKGEFVARLVEFNWNDLVKGETQGLYQNIEAAKQCAKAGRQDDSSYSGGAWTDLPKDDREFLDHITAVDGVEGFEMVIDLIPKDWRLGSSTYPEKWVFKVVDDKVIIEAKPYGRYHDEFPASILPMDFDAYRSYSISMLDRLLPLNDAMTWLLNQHFWNVRASLGNNFIYDPSMVVNKDLTRRGTSKLFRLKESAYGKDVRSVIQQVQVADVTRGNIPDMQELAEYLARTSGVNDNLMGQVHSGGRKSATEIRTSSTFGVNRLKTVAEYWSAIAMTPLAQRLISNTQQYYDQTQQFNIAGGLAVEAGTIQVSPEQITGQYDFVPVDGTMPIDRYAQANLFREILMGAKDMPYVAQKYDLGKMFGWMAQLAGLKNIKQFEVQIMPDNMIGPMAQQGNIVPIGQTAQDLDRVPEPGQLPGMGTTG